MPYVGWSSVANQANTTTGAALEVNGQVTSSLYFGAGMGGEGATNLMLAPSLNLNFALFGQTTLDPRINFSRTTNATVTNSAGKITYAPHNLLTYSEQFDNAVWNKIRATVSANTINAPDGTTTADSLIEDTTASNTHNLSRILGNPLGAGIYTYTTYLKNNGRRYLQLVLNVSPGVSNIMYGATFDLNSGVVSSIASANSPTSTGNSIQSVGNGWYRCSVSIGNPNGLRVDISHYLSTSDSPPLTGLNYTGDGVSGAYIWGAQLEIGSTATTYNSTTVKNLLGYSELFDNAAWTKSNSFVQTNLLTYSEAFDNAAWTKAANTTVTANFALAPNGYQTADRLQLPATGLTSMFQAISLTSGVTYTFSVYVKATSSNSNFDLFQGTTQLGTQTATSNWQRFTYTFTSGTTGSVNIGINNGDDSYASDILIWGAQLVQGSVAGDYRRTDAAALPVYYPNHNGVMCAEKLVENTAVTAAHSFLQSVSLVNGTTYTYSIYAKAGERNIIWLRATGTGNIAGAYFDLSLGTVTSVTSGSAAIQSIGNGWYRCSVKGISDLTGSGNQLVYLVSTGITNQYTGDGTSGVYLFGAQFSDSASLDPYVLNAGAAPTAAAYYGARFDYDPVTLAPKGLLIEEQRTNLTTYSGTTSDVVWSGNFVAKTSTNNLAPDGSNTALLATSTGSSAQHYFIAGSVTFVSGTTYTMSCFVKAGTTNLVQLTGAGGAFGTAQYANFLLSGAGSVVFSTGGTASIQQWASNWYRIIFTATATASIGGAGMLFAYIDSGTDGRAPTNSNSNSLYMWGAQVEAGAFATSYIPTAASQVTRAADIATIQGSNFYSWYNQNEGSIQVNTSLSAKPSLSALGIYSIDDGTTSNAYPSFYDAGVYINSRVAGVGVFSSTSGAISASEVTHKQSFAYKVASYSSYLDNVQLGTQLSGAIPLVNNIKIGAYNSKYTNGTIKQISYYPQRLSDSVLKGLTA